MYLLNNIDMNILFFIRKHFQNKILDILMPFVTYLGDKGLIWIIVTILLISIKKHKKEGYILLSVLILSTILGEGLLKHIIRRPRPFQEMQTIKLLIKKPSSYSFPSGHTTSSFAAAGVLGYYFKKYKVYFYALAVLIAFSRIYLFVHYPSDVLAGIILGLFSSVVVLKISNKGKVDNYEKSK